MRNLLLVAWLMAQSYYTHKDGHRVTQHTQIHVSLKQYDSEIYSYRRTWFRMQNNYIYTVERWNNVQ